MYVRSRFQCWYERLKVGTHNMYVSTYDAFMLDFNIEMLSSLMGFNQVGCFTRFLVPT